MMTQKQHNVLVYVAHNIVAEKSVILRLRLKLSPLRIYDSVTSVLFPKWTFKYFERHSMCYLVIGNRASYDMQKRAETVLRSGLWHPETKLSQPAAYRYQQGYDQTHRCLHQATGT
ncbi:hypothetical protein ABBQ38_002926 [Trebouxia sp. C0009 RCD-2024]